MSKENDATWSIQNKHINTDVLNKMIKEILGCIKSMHRIESVPSKMAEMRSTDEHTLGEHSEKKEQ